ncbi:HNH endonuclease family protein [Desulfurobacterium sp.]|uniref:HNH endonuclease family protein n=1 Tax=Desulfurobacterium sp. TaxID=2004706 RepID=UPI00261526FC|nr:HNH endonuclease family protein [Desulfurobacterium sp.]
MAMKIFQTINDRGKPLYVLEKIKSYLFYVSNKYCGAALSSEINECFSRIFEAYDEIKTMGEKLRIELINGAEFTEDSILRYHFVLFSPENYDATPERIFEYIKNKIESLKRNVKELVSFISSYVQDLKSVFESLRNVLKEYGKFGMYYEIIAVLGLSETLYPLVIALEKRNMLGKLAPVEVASGKTFFELVRDIDVRVYKIKGINPRAEISRFAHVLNTQELSNEEVARWLIEYRNKWMPDSELAIKLQENLYGNKAVPYLLIKYSEYLRKRSYTFEELMELKNIRITVEHILPKEPNFDVKVYDFDNEEDYLKHKDKLGNLTLLSRSISSQVENKTLLAKISYYNRENRLLEITRRLASEIERKGSFTKRDVIERTKAIAEFVRSFLS